MQLRMTTNIPLVNDLTVEDLIEILQQVPEKSSKIIGRHTAADRFGSDSYRLEIVWNKEISKHD